MASNRPMDMFDFPKGYLGQKEVFGKQLTVECPGYVDTVTGGSKNPISHTTDNWDAMIPTIIRTPTLGPFKHVK